MEVNGYKIEPYANLRRAELSWVNLSGADLSRADLYKANLSGANLQETDLREANMRWTNLRWANLYGANLCGTDLYGANLVGANLELANLRGADLSEADLSGADLYKAHLYGADLRGANLSGAKLPAFQITPQGYPLYGFKKTSQGVVVLLIPPKAKRTATLVGRKCRAEFAIVVEGQGSSGHDPDFFYETGKTVYPDKYDDDIRIECTNGIHFFLTREEAEAY